MMCKICDEETEYFEMYKNRTSAIEDQVDALEEIAKAMKEK